MNTINVLDKGFIELVDSMGSDLTVVNSARVSFAKRSEWEAKASVTWDDGEVESCNQLKTEDEKLIAYLAKNKHWSPFRHVQLQFHVKAPEFVARQWYKHVVGCNFTSAGAGETDHAWNEVSQRYVEAEEFDFYIPDSLRRQSESNKQASEGLVTPNQQMMAERCIKQVTDLASAYYKDLRGMTVAREQARMLLPLNVYTEYYWTASLQAVVNFIQLRNHKHAQGEIQEYAKAMEELALKVCPFSLRQLLYGEFAKL